MSTSLSTKLIRKTFIKLHSDNKQLDLQILAIKNELDRIRAKYEQDMRNLQTTQEHLNQIEKEIKHFPKDGSK
ncbi:hypothetical protein ACFP7A_04890 [Sporolactobacillus kofuensis]|uniref:Uncharacterized protein n=1 Tax=Sporolactobacillus kofuensis TaxID=269672 RepID=A0ABW1WEC5_9BACL|nr:hypothetical protein [Sporolactobacillus kofuensis]MCO7174819.1 hypothetical protein [Sporolactobacillus kofuensis]